MRTLLVAIALALANFSSFANDSERISQLENAVNELRMRVKQLENSQSNSSNQHKQVVVNEGAKSLANWRRLNKGMSYNDVRGILGEPSRIDTGGFTYWHYANNGRVVFYNDKLDGWKEPQ